jgi:hypothetical protein
MVRTRGKAHGVGAKGSFAEARGQTPGTLASGPDTEDPGVWSWSPRRTLALRAKPTLRRLFLQETTQGSTNKSRGRASTRNTSRFTKPCAGNPAPSSLSFVIVSVVVGEALRGLFFTTTVTTPSCYRNSSTTSPLLLDREGEDIIELNVC